MNKHTHTNNDTPHYYLVTIGSINDRRLFQTNNERAFIVSQLQDLLSSRSILEAPEPHRHLSAHIDLLGFSVHERDVRLVVFAISIEALHTLTRSLTRRLHQYQSDVRATKSAPLEPVSMTIRLSGPHHALATVTNLHLRHNDWEYDRYSSIGFYLHDRRGDWMRLWRLATVFDNDPAHYFELLEAQRHNAYSLDALSQVARADLNSADPGSANRNSAVDMPKHAPDHILDHVLDDRPDS